MSCSVGKPPNLVYVFADQLRYQSCGYAGDTRAHTPNIDRFAIDRMNLEVREYLSVHPSELMEQNAEAST